MPKDTGRGKPLYEGLISALAAGGFFIIVGLMFVITPDLWGKMVAFFGDFTTKSYPTSSTSTLSLWVPANPAAHLDFFMAVVYFFLAMGILQVVILAVRSAFKSRVGRIAETLGHAIFWLGGGVTAYVFLLAGTLTGWFQFWALLIILVGVSLIARGGVLFAARSMKPKAEACC